MGAEGVIDMPKGRPDGYVPEKRGDRTLHRVRVEGDKRTRITIPVGPSDDAFWEHYYAARAGRRIETPTRPRQILHKTLRGMVQGYIAWLTVQVSAGSASPLTLRQRRSLLLRVCDMPDEDGTLMMGDYDAALPPAAMLHIQDQWGDRTSQADNARKGLSAAYKWGIPRGWAGHNPTAGIDNIHRNRGGATPWSPADLKAFLDCHPEDSMARTWLMVAIWTGARISDLVRLGRQNEVVRHGVRWIDWMPGKKGSKRVVVPMSPQLIEVTRAPEVIGRAYILGADGQPFMNAPSLGNKVRDWVGEAGLTGRSSHGLRKSMGALLAEAGATQHQIMAVMAHTKPQTSAIYTESAERAALAGQAMATLQGLRIG